MKATPLILVLLLVTSCANQTRIHIFNEGFDSAAVSDLANLLAENGFDARPNELPVPASIPRHTVIFPALVQDFALVESIEAILIEAGYDKPRLIRQSEANHFFSTANIGIYLINPDAEFDPVANINDPYSLENEGSRGADEGIALTYNYFSECPRGSEAQSELNLYPGGTAIVEEFSWDEGREEEISTLHEAEWSVENSMLSVNLFSAGELQFSITEHKGSNWQGSYEGLTLVAIDSTADFEFCNYTHLRYVN